MKVRFLLVLFFIIIKNIYSGQNEKLWNAVHNEYIPAIHKAIQKGASVNIVSDDKHKFPLIIKAVNTGNDSIVKMLLDKGANINSVSSSGYTALTVSVINNDIKMFNFLLSNNADYHIKDKEGKTILHWASIFADSEIIKLIIKNKVNVDCTDKYGITPLMISALNGRNDIIEYLISHGANIFHKNAKGENALLFAVYSNNLKSIQLLDKKDSINNSFNDAHKFLKDKSNGKRRRYETGIARGKNPDVIKKSLRDQGITNFTETLCSEDGCAVTYRYLAGWINTQRAENAKNAISILNNRYTTNHKKCKIPNEHNNLTLSFKNDIISKITNSKANNNALRYYPWSNATAKFYLSGDLNFGFNIGNLNEVESIVNGGLNLSIGYNFLKYLGIEVGIGYYMFGVKSEVYEQLMILKPDSANYYDSLTHIKGRLHLPIGLRLNVPFNKNKVISLGGGFDLSLLKPNELQREYHGFYWKAGILFDRRSRREFNVKTIGFSINGIHSKYTGPELSHIYITEPFKNIKTMNHRLSLSFDFYIAKFRLSNNSIENI